jgi:predicted GH43/DUF377 family glycosyl hydrolase
VTHRAGHTGSCEAEGKIPVRRSGSYLYPDKSRTLLRPFLPGGDERAKQIIKLILQQSPDEVECGLRDVKRRFTHRPVDLEALLTDRYRQLRHLQPEASELSSSQAMLIAAYFMNEYSLQSAALFNPSIVPHPDQEGVPPGSLRFIMSLRATGEGHISSIEFRSGLIGREGDIAFDAASGFVTTPEMRSPRHRKTKLVGNLRGLGIDELLVATALAHLPEEFDLRELETALRDSRRWLCAREVSASEREQEHHLLRVAVRSVTECDYLLRFPASLALSERAIFPVAASERNGIEDARFVHFHEGDGTCRYYATYTAFDGSRILPHLLETEDFLSFRLCPLRGRAASDKGMALFPRRIGGRYAMLGRQGGMNISLMFSDDVHRWDDHEVLFEPEAPWELVQLGNCGSPLETEAGWLVLTHGVGAMRNYRIGAALLDRDDPRRVIGRLRQPLLEPLDQERQGYVPNVVYSCGSQIHNGWLVLPYAVSDHATTTAFVQLEPLLDQLTGQDSCSSMT